MCSIAMPGELMLGHSPPVYGRHPLYRPPPTVPSPSVNHRVASVRSVPPRPCLTTASILDGIRNNSGATVDAVADLNGRADNGRRKKRVVFADDRGRPLTQVRVMSEASNAPPAWTSAYLASVTRGLRTEEPSSRWETSFVQPASDYLAFGRKLDEEAVTLENVILREAEGSLVGTIKVKNLAYDKEVIVRASSDGWQTHEDVHCTYVERPSVARAALVLYDTFRFRLLLPPSSDTLEFCVRYRVNLVDYWDNNGGKNYVVRRRHEKRAAGNVPAEIEHSANNNRNGGEKFGLLSGGSAASSGTTATTTRIAEASRASAMTWSEFAAWQHLNNDAPYW